MTNGPMRKLDIPLKRRSIYLNYCDDLDRPMAVVSPDGRWTEETDNVQGSPYVRWEN